MHDASVLASAVEDSTNVCAPTKVGPTALLYIYESRGSLVTQALSGGTWRIG